MGDEQSYTVTVAHALFDYHVSERGRRKTAMRGETITIGQADYDRGMQHGAFVANPDELIHHGLLPSLDFLVDNEGDLDEDDLDELNSWMRSASPADVAAALAEYASHGADIAGDLLVGELSRGSEVRQEVLDLLNNPPTVTPPESLSEIPDGSRASSEPASVLVPEGDLEAQLSWVREGVDSAERSTRASALYAHAQTVDGIDLESLHGQLTAAVHQEAPAPAAPAPPTPPAPLGTSADDLPASDRIDDIVAWVDDDPGRAAVALGREREARGEKARPRLVEVLKPIAAGGDA